MERQTLAAVDLGSNSFHLLVAQLVDGQLLVIDRVKERVRLAAGLDATGNLDAASRERALAALAQFRDRLGAVPEARVRAVGTNTLRRAARADDFVAEAEATLGHHIEIVSGHEEARLVYQGVAQEVEDEGGRRLVVDIGGGSTECIVGDGAHILRADSLFMGCVSYTRRFFEDGAIRAETLRRAVMAAEHELGSVERIYAGIGWDRCYGSSGTIKAVQACLLASGWSAHAITRPGLEQLREALCEAGHVDALDLPGINAQRAPVIAGGVAVLSGLFDALDIERMVASEGALREGVLLDLVGRALDRDVRDRTVLRLRVRFRGDAEQAARVDRLALHLLARAEATWCLEPTETRRMLRWAAQLREIGKAVSYTGYHRHGAYLVRNSHMPGFSQGEQAVLAALILCQRRKLARSRVEDLVGTRRADDVLRMALLLRLASRLHRARSPEPFPEVDLEVGERTVHLTFPAGWLDARPLTLADLGHERRHFASVGYALSW